jgi:hypothetical protein
MSAKKNPSDNPSPQTKSAASDEPHKPLTPAAQRALAEAAARRDALDRKAAERTKEVHGPQGPEPTRFGDWERKGLASDF